MSIPERHECPARGGAGGGPFGRANSGWDVETYECPRCEGWGYIREAVAALDEDPAPMPKPGIVKTTPETRAAAASGEKKRRASGR